MKGSGTIANKTLCHHCGDTCPENPPSQEGLSFCCQGCLTVYTILHQNGLDDYYTIEQRPGSSFRSRKNKNYDYLKQPEIADLLLESKIPHHHRIRWKLPAIHCASCIWLLENLHKLHPGVQNVRVHFLKKEASILYDEEQISLSQLAELLDKIGYDPELNFANLDQNVKVRHKDKSLLYKLGLAGFGFGNIMLLSFPDYLGLVENDIGIFIGYLMIALATPVLLYSGNHYLRSAFHSLKTLNPGIDIPIALGMLTLYFRSVFEIITQSGDGYLDSLVGFIFFLLIGKWFQDYTHYSISFDRNYKSYFPISANVLVGEKWIPKPLHEIDIHDELLIKNEEIIPCDSILLSERGRIDYSFVTGESNPVSVLKNEEIFAGGKQKGGAIKVKVRRNINQSYLTDLWNNEIFSKKEESIASRVIDKVSRHFIIAILVIAVATLIYWYPIDGRTAFNAFTAVLIIACPCVLALAVPFIYGNAVRMMALKNIFIKNVKTLENIQDIDTIIFDKTGTITDNTLREVVWEGNALSAEESTLIVSLAMHSSHPLSVAITEFLSCDPTDLDAFEEFPGKGIQGRIGKNTIRLGSSSFIFGLDNMAKNQEVLVEINGHVPGSFVFKNHLREGIHNIITDLAPHYNLGLLSGDNTSEKVRMQELFGNRTECLFDQKPADKLQYIKDLQQQGKKVMMIGDGLNDAGALKQSDVGVVISDSNNNFTPSCDVIVAAERFEQLNNLFQYADKSKVALYGGFAFSFIYNIVGLGFAVSGLLTPVVAAILMPISSITIIIYGVAVSSWLANRLF